MGEPAGIGGELSLKAWSMRRPRRSAVLRARRCRPAGGPRRQARLDVPLRTSTVRGGWRRVHDGTAGAARALARPGEGRPARSGQRAGHLEAIERAVELALAGEIAGMVTNPIQKKTLQEAGFRHPGHTEYLAELAGGVDVAMMLACPELRVVPVTIHLSLAEAYAPSTAEIVRAGRITAAGLKVVVRHRRPRLAVAALNPHAGEQGTMGDEEIRVIAPAVEALRREGIDVRGPAPADTLFHAGGARQLRRRRSACITTRP